MHSQLNLGLGAIWYIVFLFSTTCHEAAHALVAKIGGDPTASQGGQVSLNPIPHIKREPFGTVIVPILSYLTAGWMIGWASAPYDPEWQHRYPKRAAWMALAGPSANLVLAIIAAIGIRIGMMMGAFQQPERAGFTHVTQAVTPGGELAATFLSVLFVLNILLFFFNLIPVPPLDGSNAIMLLFSESMALRYMEFSRKGFGFLGLILAWFLFDKIFGVLFVLALNILYPGARYG